jgi:hypothetical protein
VHSQLDAGERIVSDFGPYYATSKRVLLYADTRRGALLRELPYSRIASIDLVNGRDHRMMVLGVFLAILGLMLTFVWGLILPLLIFPFSFFALGVGLMGKPAFYQLRGTVMSPQELQEWQVSYRGAGSFIASIRTIMGEVPDR